MRPRLVLPALAAAGLTAVVALAATAGAHNPALTLYEPAALDGDRLATAGEEGTLAVLDHEGRPVWTGNRTLHVTGPPVAHGAVAAVSAQTVDEGIPKVLAFGADGVVFEQEVGEAGRALLTATDDGFLAATTEGRVVQLSPSGEVRSEASLPLDPTTRLEPGPEGGWVLAGEGRVAIVEADGTPRHETGVSARPSDVAVHGGTILVAVYGQPRGSGALEAFEPDLTSAWVHDVGGLRVGGEVATSDQGAVVGTFDPNGARVLALTSDGQPRWERSIEDATAAAVTAHEGTAYAVTNDGLATFALDDGAPGWTAEFEPRVVSPRAVGDVLVPSGANDTLAGFTAEDGQRRWTYTDDTSEVPWSEHEIQTPDPDDGTADGAAEGDDAETVPAPGALVALGVGLALARLGRRS